MDAKDSAYESSSRDSLYYLRDYIYYHKQNVGRNVNIKVTSGEGSEGNEEHLEIGGKGILVI